jgi:hypothetical protein
LQAEPDQVEVTERGERLQRVERQPVPAQFGFPVDPGCECPLARPLRIGIEQAVENLEPVVAHPELVGVRERQAEPSADVVAVLDDAVQFAADVLGRRGDAGQQPENRFLERGVEHPSDSGTQTYPVRLTARRSGTKGPPEKCRSNRRLDSFVRGWDTPVPKEFTFPK